MEIVCTLNNDFINSLEIKKFKREGGELIIDLSSILAKTTNLKTVKTKIVKDKSLNNEECSILDGFLLDIKKILNFNWSWEKDLKPSINFSIIRNSITYKNIANLKCEKIRDELFLKISVFKIAYYSKELVIGGRFKKAFKNVFEIIENKSDGERIIETTGFNIPLFVDSSNDNNYLTSLNFTMKNNTMINIDYEESDESFLNVQVQGFSEKKIKIDNPKYISDLIFDKIKAFKKECVL